MTFPLASIVLPTFGFSVMRRENRVGGPRNLAIRRDPGNGGSSRRAVVFAPMNPHTGTRDPPLDPPDQCARLTRRSSPSRCRWSAAGTYPLVDVRVHRVVRQGQVALVEQVRPQRLQVVGADGGGEDGQQVADADGRRRPIRRARVTARCQHRRRTRRRASDGDESGTAITSGGSPPTDTRPVADALRDEGDGLPGNAKTPANAGVGGVRRRHSPGEVPGTARLSNPAPHSNPASSGPRHPAPRQGATPEVARRTLNGLLASTARFLFGCHLFFCAISMRNTAGPASCFQNRVSVPPASSSELGSAKVAPTSKCVLSTTR